MLARMEQPFLTSSIMVEGMPIVFMHLLFFSNVCELRLANSLSTEKVSSSCGIVTLMNKSTLLAAQELPEFRARKNASAPF